MCTSSSSSNIAAAVGDIMMYFSDRVLQPTCRYTFLSRASVCTVITAPTHSSLYVRSVRFLSFCVFLLSKLFIVFSHFYLFLVADELELN